MASIAERSLQFMGLFEAEVLTHLMLSRWGHPLAEDANYRNDLIEAAANILRQSIAGELLIESLPPRQMNLIAALWYSEWVALEGGEPDPHGRRRQWTDAVKHALPSCFAAQNLVSE